MCGCASQSLRRKACIIGRQQLYTVSLRCSFVGDVSCLRIKCGDVDASSSWHTILDYSQGVGLVRICSGIVAEYWWSVMETHGRGLAGAVGLLMVNVFLHCCYPVRDGQEVTAGPRYVSDIWRRGTAFFSEGEYIGYRQLLWPLLNPPLLKISVGSKSGNSEHYYLLNCITF